MHPMLVTLGGTGILVALYMLAQNLLVLAWVLGDLLVRLGGGEGLEVLGGLGMAGILERYQIPVLVILVLSQIVFFGLGPRFIARRWQPELPPVLHGMTRFRPLHMVLALIGLAGIFPLAMLASEIFVRLFPVLKNLEDGTVALITWDSMPLMWVVLAGTALTPAIFEEIIFRGFFHGGLRRRLRGPWPVLISGLVFGLVHQNYFGLVTLVMVGLYLGFVFDRSGSVWTGSAVHLAYNAFILFLVNTSSLANLLLDAEGMIRLDLVWFGLPLAAVAMLLLVMVTRNTRLSSLPVPGPGSATDTR